MNMWMIKQNLKTDKFYSQLSQSDISNENNEHAQNVWNTFNIKNMGEYHDI